MEKKNKIAIFDFDGTLTSKDTFIEFAIHAVGMPRFLTALTVNLFSLIAWKLGLKSNHQAKQALFRTLYKGMSNTEFNKKCEEFSSKINSFIRKEVYYELLQHIENTTPVYIISASIENWIKPWALDHGIAEVIATIPEIDKNNRLTGRFLTKNCYGKEKIARLRSVFPEITSSEIWAYGDSKGDKDILQISHHPFLVKGKSIKALCF